MRKDQYHVSKREKLRSRSNSFLNQHRQDEVARMRRSPAARAEQRVGKHVQPDSVASRARRQYHEENPDTKPGSLSQKARRQGRTIIGLPLLRLFVREDTRLIRVGAARPTYEVARIVGEGEQKAIAGISLKEWDDLKAYRSRLKKRRARAARAKKARQRKRALRYAG